MDLMERMGGNKLGPVTGGRIILRLLFFTAETGTLAGWFIFTGGASDNIYYRGILMEPFNILLPFAYGSFFGLPVVSFFIRRSDGTLAKIGFGTFFGILLLVAAFQLF